MAGQGPTRRARYGWRCNSHILYAISTILDFASRITARPIPAKLYSPAFYRVKPVLPVQIVTRVGKFPYREDGGSLVKRICHCVFGTPAGISTFFKSVKVMPRKTSYLPDPIAYRLCLHSQSPAGISCILKTMKVRVQQDIYHRIPVKPVPPVYPCYTNAI